MGAETPGGCSCAACVTFQVWPPAATLHQADGSLPASPGARLEAGRGQHPQSQSGPAHAREMPSLRRLVSGVTVA